MQHIPTTGTLLLVTTMASAGFLCSMEPILTFYAFEGQIVDAVIMPVAPHAAVIPGKYYHVGVYISGNSMFLM